MTLAPASGIDYDALIQDHRVHSRVYYDPAIFEEEMEKIWYREWIYVGHESEIPETGDYRTRMIGLQPIIMTRDEDGGVHLLMNRCAHRGNTVCQMERGNSHAFRCAYHGWTFANDGHLLGVTYASAYGPDFNRNDYALTKVPRMAMYRGFIFGSMSPDGISLDEHLGNAKPLLDRFIDLSPEGELEVRSGIHKVRYGANWKMQMENSVDNYHANFVHASAFQISKEKWANSISVSADDSAALARSLGDGHAQLDFWPQFRKVGRTPNAVASPYSEETRVAYAEAMEQRYGKEYAYTLMSEGAPHVMIFPNLFLINSDIRIIQPVSVKETFIYQYPVFLKGAPKEMNTFRLRVHEGAYGPAGFVLSDDMDIFERNQAALEARATEWISLRRGLHREQLDRETGIRSSHMTDETTQRGQWRHIKMLLQRS